ncbi:MAG: bifunctional phosphopantothenoylcysteine decarboxylase/phosphopantothenate--cysteine ligase CoaBC [Christensenellales bacterium]
MKEKTIVLGICGSIAAYKAAEIGSRLKKLGFTVVCVMTQNASRFITPLTMETISGQPVASDLWTRNRPHEVEHISIAQQADLFLIAPASANFIGKYANGVADDMLTTILLAAKAPVIIAPAMNSAMFEHDAVQSNIAKLKERGCSFIEPVVGRLACGDVGTGKLAPVEDIVTAVENYFHTGRDMEGIRLLVTAGPTRERLDPVRFISNFSSGKMGYALAEAAAKRGASVVLVSGPVSLDAPYNVERITVESTQDMFEAVNSRFESCDIVIKAAAPADYSPGSCSEQKIKKDDNGMVLQLQRTVDILAELGKRKTPKQVLVGFAAETQDLEKYATEKLKNKNLDMIVANDVLMEGAGFDSDTNIVTIYAQDKKDMLPKLPKIQVAHAVLDKATSIFRSKNK